MSASLEGAPALDDLEPVAFPSEGFEDDVREPPQDNIVASIVTMQVDLTKMCMSVSLYYSRLSMSMSKMYTL